MYKYSTLLFALFISTSCVSVTTTDVHKISTSKLEKPIRLIAIKNHLPGGVGNQPAYTIYDGSYWNCNNETKKHDLVCCSEKAFSTSSPWKYCLLVDRDYNAFAFFELGMNSYRNWPEGKQPIFKRVEK